MLDRRHGRWAQLPYEFLDHVSRRIINEIDVISRVTYHIYGKPPATIKWEQDECMFWTGVMIFEFYLHSDYCLILKRARSASFSS
jgi:hypothetical protein